MQWVMDLDTLAKRMEWALIRRGWSAATLADKLRISTSFLSQIKAIMSPSPRASMAIGPAPSR